MFLAALDLQAQTPEISRVANTASLSGIVSPGSLVTIFGDNFGADAANTSVSVGGLEAPILFASNDQINVQFPFDLPVGPAALRVVARMAASQPVNLAVAAYSPAFFTTGHSDTDKGIFANMAGLLIATAAPGQTITAYLTGLGATGPQVPTGTRVPPDPPSPCVTKPTLSVGGLDATILFAGLTPGFTSVYQVSFVVPNVGPGDHGVVLSIGGVSSPPVALAVGSSPALTVLSGANPGIRIDSTAENELPAQDSVPADVATMMPAVNGPLAVIHSIQPVQPQAGRAPSASMLESSLGAARVLEALGTGVATSSVHGTITYTCDPSINAVAGVCNTLNTTIAGLYANAFTNANASIYITFGNTGLGQSVTALDLFSYSGFRSALIANEADADDITAVTSSVPAANPFVSDLVALTNANARALGLSAGFGLRTDEGSCNSGSAGCYDGIVTLSSAIQSNGQFYFRSGPIGSNQYDFYTVVEHETDEVLGTASCAFGCNFGGNIAFSPPDLFRYHSNGTRSFGAGNNSSCAASNPGNACFSIDGIHMLEQYNNVNNGNDAGDWTTNCSSQLVQDEALCAGAAGIDISPSAEIKVLDVVGFNLSASPSLSISKTHAGNFTPGQQNAQYFVTVSNAAGSSATSGTVTVTETPPSGLVLVSMSGSGWSCGSTTCTRSDALSPGASYPAITITVNVAANPTSPQVNAVSVSGGGSLPANATDSTVISAVINNPALSITKSHSGSFTLGQQNALYTVTVSNAANAAPTSGTVTVTETIPAGLTLVSMSGTGWNCSLNACSRSDVLNPGSSYSTITVTVNVATNAPSPVTNRVSVSGDGSNTAAATDITNLVPPLGQHLQFVPLPPCRVADTRNASGPFGGPALGASSSRDFAIPASACGIPATAQAYSLNLTVVPSGPLGFISVWPAGQTQPVVSTLNSTDGRIKANAAIVPAGVNGAITVFASNPTNLIIDINGYFVAPQAQSLAFYPLTPCRIADTRLGTGTFAGPSLAPSVARDFPILASACNVPSNAQAYALNMTVVPSGSLGFLSAWPTGSPQPGSSTLNAPTGAVTANAAVVPAGTGGAIRVVATNTTDLIIDINGYFAPPGGPGALSLYAVTPCRIADTRGAAGPLGGPQLSAAVARSFPVPSSACQIPASAQAYSLNATVVPPAGLGFLTLWGNGAMPTVSTLNDSDGNIVANAAIVPAASDGSVSAFATNATHLILDINGYFAP